MRTPLLSLSPPLSARSPPLSNLRSEMLSTLSNRKSVNGFTEKCPPSPSLSPFTTPYVCCLHLLPQCPTETMRGIQSVLLKGHSSIVLFKLKHVGVFFFELTPGEGMPPERLSCQLTPKRKPDAREVGRASDACLDLATDYLKTRQYTEGGTREGGPRRPSAF